MKPEWEAAVDRLRDAEAAVDSAKAELRTLMRVASDSFESVGDVYDAMRFFYWEVPDLPVKDILNAFNVSKTHLMEVIEGYTVILKCASCGTDNEIWAKSRANLANLQREWRRSNVFDITRILPALLCPLCELKREDAIIGKQRNYEESKRKQEERLAQLRSMPYGEYLRTPEWAAKRASALQLYNFRCALCNAKNNLNVHHRTYERRGNEFMKDLIVLCEPCHAKFHNKLPRG